MECFGLQKSQVMVTSFGYCSVDGMGTPNPPPLQSPNRWRSCKLQGKIGESEKEDGRGIVMEVTGV